MPGEIVAAFPDKGTAFVRTEFSEKMPCNLPDATEATSGKKVYASIRPEDVEIFEAVPPGKENLFKGVITHKAYLGNFMYLFISINNTKIRVQVSHYVPQEEGQELFVFLNPEKCNILF
jgi:ABC-type sugar transport system ATPase subunit